MEEIGRRLRTAREEKGISLATAEEETKIRRKYLEALESGQEADLPGDVYLKGFLRSYGNFLGLDGSALVDGYKERKAAKARERAAHEAGDGHHGRSTSATAGTAHTGASAAKAAPVGAAVPARTAAPLAPEADKPVRRSGSGSWIYSRQAGWVVLGVIVISLIGYGGYRVLGQLGEPEAPPPVVDTPAPQPEPQPQPKPEPPPEPPKVTMNRKDATHYEFAVPFDAVRLKVQVGPSPVWLEATVDGKEVFSKTTPQSQEFQGRAVTVVAGHLSGVKLLVNDQEFDLGLKDGPYYLTFKATK